MLSIRLFTKLGILPRGLLACVMGLATTLAAQTVKERRLAPDLYLLQGGGANALLYATKTDAVLVNTKAADANAALTKKLGELTKNPIRYVVLTQAGADYVGNAGAFGASTDLISHDFVRVKLARAAAAGKVRLPDVTFAQATSFHFADETMRLTYRGPAVSDGDLSVWFRSANVIYAGPLLSAGQFPLLDTENGADLTGLLTAVAEILGRCDDKTQIVPAYGDPVGKVELVRFQLMLQSTSKLVRNAMRAGRTVEQMEADELLGSWADWGRGRVSMRQWIETVAQVTAR